MDTFPKFIAAAVQAAPVFLDRAATTRKACDLIREAGAAGARLIVFPEVFIAGYPYWNWLDTPYAGSKWFLELYKQSVDVPGPVVDALGAAAREANAYVVMGVNERDTVRVGTIYNTNLIFGPDGSLIGRHRKLVPTWAEKLTYSPGDGSSMKVYPTEIGRIGTLICGENTNTLARFALLSEGELIHTATFPAWPFVSNQDMPEDIKIRIGAHAFEGKIFAVAASGAMSDEIVDMLADTEEKRVALTGTPNAFSGIFGPNGRLISEPIIDVEGISYGEIDLEKCVEPRQLHHITGHYNRFDIFDLHVNRVPLAPIRVTDGAHQSLADDSQNESSTGVEFPMTAPL
jgi:predicted amidohydrolase